MKGYTSLAAGFLGASAVATKPIGDMKYMDWDKIKQIVRDNPKAEIEAGLMEDWGNTSGLIYKNGKYYNGGCLYGQSAWATPIVDIDGKEIKCCKLEPNGFSGIPDWWGDGEKVLDEWDEEDD